MFRHNDRDRAANDQGRHLDYHEYENDDVQPYSPNMNEDAGPRPSADLDLDRESEEFRTSFPSPPPQPSMRDQGSEQGTIVGASATFSGTLSSDGPVTIVGALDGEIMAAGDVTIASGATVRARIQAITLQVAGTFQGSVACTHRFVVLETGRVRADILAPAIVVHDGATINGRFRIRNDDETAEPLDAPADTESETGGLDPSGSEGSE